MLIRPAVPSDAPGLALVHVESWRETYRGIIPDVVLDGLSVERRAANWTQMLSQPDAPGVTYVVEDDSRRIVGFASGGLEREGDPDYTGELYAIYVLKAAQGRGLGLALTEAVAVSLLQLGCVSMLVWVLADNPAREFYAHLGGTVIREKTIDIGGAPLREVAYGWRDMRILTEG